MRKFRESAEVLPKVAERVAESAVAAGQARMRRRGRQLVIEAVWPRPRPDRVNDGKKQVVWACKIDWKN